MKKTLNSTGNLANTGRVDLIGKEIEALNAYRDRLISQIDDLDTKQRNIDKVLADNKEELKTAVVAHPELRRMSIAVDKARDMLMKIGTDELTELITYRNPPERVKMVIQAMVFALKGQNLIWEKIQKEMASDFIDRVVSVQWDLIDPQILSELKDKYLENPNWDIAKIYRASRAAGPLADWLESQVKIIEFLSQGGIDTSKVQALISAKNKLIIEEQKVRSEYQQSLNEKNEIENQIKLLNAQRAIFMASRIKVEKIGGFTGDPNPTSLKSQTSSIISKTLEKRDQSRKLFDQKKPNNKDKFKSRDNSRTKLKITPHNKALKNDLRSTLKSQKIEEASERKTVAIDRKYSGAMAIRSESLKPPNAKKATNTLHEKDKNNIESERNRFDKYDFTITPQPKAQNEIQTGQKLEFKGFGNETGAPHYKHYEGQPMYTRIVPKIIEIHTFEKIYDYTDQHSNLNYDDDHNNTNIGHDQYPQYSKNTGLYTLPKDTEDLSNQLINNSSITFKCNGKPISPEEYELSRSQYGQMQNVSNVFYGESEITNNAQRPYIGKARLLNSRSVDYIKPESYASLSRTSGLSSKFSVNKKDKPLWNTKDPSNKNVYMPDDEREKTLFLANMFKESEIFDLSNNKIEKQYYKAPGHEMDIENRIRYQLKHRDSDKRFDYEKIPDSSRGHEIRRLAPQRYQFEGKDTYTDISTPVTTISENHFVNQHIKMDYPNNEPTFLPKYDKQLYKC